MSKCGSTHPLFFFPSLSNKENGQKKKENKSSRLSSSVQRAGTRKYTLRLSFFKTARSNTLLLASLPCTGFTQVLNPSNTKPSPLNHTSDAAGLTLPHQVVKVRESPRSSVIKSETSQEESDTSVPLLVSSLKFVSKLKSLYHHP